MSDPLRPPRRWVPFSAEMTDALERLQISYPQISRTQLSSEALRRGLFGMLGSTPTLMPQAVAELRRAG